jgi:hypothetical protein
MGWGRFLAGIGELGRRGVLFINCQWLCSEVWACARECDVSASAVARHCLKVPCLQALERLRDV